MSANRSLSSETHNDNLAGVFSLYLSKPGDLNEALTPSPDSPATRRASHGRPTWGTRGARAASLRVTLTLYPRAALVVSGGKATYLSNVLYADAFFLCQQLAQSVATSVSSSNRDELLFLLLPPLPIVL